MDGNVYRVLSRVFEIDTAIDSSKGKREFFELAQELLDKKNPDLYNQAMMDLGAMVCMPSNPLCINCPLKTICQSFQNGSYDNFPVKEKKTKQKDRYFVYVYLHDQEKIYLHRRNEKDIWTGLYEFPMIELNSPLWEEEFSLFMKEIQKLFNLVDVKEITTMPNHILSHQIIHSVFIDAIGTISTQNKSKFITINDDELENYAIPRLLELYLEKRK